MIEQGPAKSLYMSYRGRVYGTNDPTKSVKALKEVIVLMVRLQSHQVHLTVLQYYNIDKMHTYKNLSTVKWAQCDKTQSREL